MAKKNGGQVFPVTGCRGSHSYVPGMSLLDHVAVQAMRSLIDAHAISVGSVGESQTITRTVKIDVVQVAQNAYAIAAAMLAERERIGGDS